MDVRRRRTQVALICAAIGLWPTIHAAAEGPCPGGDPETCENAEEAYEEVRDTAPPPPEGLQRAIAVAAALADWGGQPPTLEFNCNASVYISRLSVFFAGKAAQADGGGGCYNEIAAMGVGDFKVTCRVKLEATVELPGEIGGTSEVIAPAGEHGNCPFPLKTEALFCARFTPLIAEMEASAVDPPSRVWLASASDLQIATC